MRALGVRCGNTDCWLHQEVQAILAAHEIDEVGIKRAETSVKRSNAL